MKTNYTGIDYSAGTGANRNLETGIRNGVIPSHDIGEGFDDIVQNGTDLDYENWAAEIKARLKQALRDYFSDRKHSGCEFSPLDEAAESAFDAISDGLNYESSGDCTRYLYERDGYVLQVASDGDIFVCKSPYFTYAQFCSPCAPGACYLRNPLTEPNEANKCYCLGGEWFSDDEPAPYPIYSVETGQLVQPV